MALTKVRGAGIDADGQEIILDADTDTTLTVDTDDQIDFKIGGTDRFAIKASGSTSVDLSAGSSMKFTVGTSGGSDSHQFINNSTERARIDSSGRLLVGTTSSGYSETGCRISAGGGIQNTVSGGQLLRLNRTTSTGNMIQFWYNGGEKGTISTNGSNVAYNTSSDYRLKENVVTDWDATTRLKALKPSRFNWKTDADTTVDGFLAHEVSSIVPEAVTGEKDAIDAEGNPEYQGIDQSKLVPLLTKALQEAMTRIETLEAEIAKLKG